METERWGLEHVRNKEGTFKYYNTGAGSNERVVWGRGIASTSRKRRVWTFCVETDVWEINTERWEYSMLKTNRAH